MPPAQPTTTPPSSVDARGRVIPVTEAERLHQAEEAIRALDSLGEIGDQEEREHTLDELMRTLDEDRLSDRKRFRQ